MAGHGYNTKFKPTRKRTVFAYIHRISTKLYNKGVLNMYMAKKINNILTSLEYGLWYK